MRVGIYNEPSGGSIGGAELTAAVLAEALAKTGQVDILHHRRSLTTEELAQFAGTNLDAVKSRYVEPDQISFGSRNPFRRYREAQNWHAALSEPYDLFINFTHNIPPFCHAAKGVLIILFPLHARPYIDFPEEGSSGVGPSAWIRLKHIYHAWEWEKRFNSYQVKAAISQFTRTWVNKRWGFDCQVLYPPVDSDFGVGSKDNNILSVGRFATEGHSKKQLEMLTAFQEMEYAHTSGWKYFSVGALGTSDADCRYFERARNLASGCGAFVLANVARARLKELYQRSTIFWHAAGYGEDERLHPELAEHFGIATGEAMAAGCIPIVVNKGSQPEIVQHGVNGFLWNTLNELKEYTVQVMRDRQLQTRVREAARIRAQSFGREQFVTRFLKFLQSD